MNRMSINANAGHRYFVRVKIPVGADMVEPTVPGTVIGVQLRISDEKPRHAVDGLSMEGGEAIDPDLDELIAVEDGDDPALFTYDVSQELHEDHIRPLRRGTEFYAIWSKDGVGDFYVDTFVVALVSNI